MLVHLIDGGAGALLGLGLAMLRHLLDTTVRTDDDVEEITEEPVIGAVHYDPRAGKEPLIVESDPSSPRSEAFRAVRTNLMFVDAANHPRTILRVQHALRHRRGRRPGQRHRPGHAVHTRGQSDQV